jgi:hypothetical protein
MRTLVSNLTAVLLVIHAMIGCCHHHWHHDDESATPKRVACCCCCDHHDPAHGTSEAPSQPCNGERECHGVCTYIATPRTSLDAATLGVDLDFAAVIPAHGGSPLSAASSLWSQLQGCDDAPPPLRLHLLHQILLI